MSKFNDAERQVIARAANAVWDEIGGDVLSAVGRESRKGRSVTLPKAEVIELVLDASRLEQKLRYTPGVDKSLIERVEADVYASPSEIEAFLKKDVFKFARYGF
jgi:hypothetical protein